MLVKYVIGLMFAGVLLMAPAVSYSGWTGYVDFCYRKPDVNSQGNYVDPKIWGLRVMSVDGGRSYKVQIRKFPDLSGYGQGNYWSTQDGQDPYVPYQTETMSEALRTGQEMVLRIIPGAHPCGYNWSGGSSAPPLWGNWADGNIEYFQIEDVSPKTYQYDALIGLIIALIFAVSFRLYV